MCCGEGPAECWLSERACAAAEAAAPSGPLVLPWTCRKGLKGQLPRIRIMGSFVPACYEARLHTAPKSSREASLSSTGKSHYLLRHRVIMFTSLIRCKQTRHGHLMVPQLYTRRKPACIGTKFRTVQTRRLDKFHDPGQQLIKGLRPQIWPCSRAAAVGAAFVHSTCIQPAADGVATPRGAACSSCPAGDLLSAPGRTRQPYSWGTAALCHRVR